MDWTGLSECDHSELGLIVDGSTQDLEALNQLIQREQEMLQLAAQVAKHGPDSLPEGKLPGLRRRASSIAWRKFSFSARGRQMRTHV